MFDTGEPAADDEIQAFVVGLVVKNTGRVPALLTSAEFRIDRGEELNPDCSQKGGPVSYQAIYDVKVPVRKRAASPFTTTRPLSHAIGPNKLEKLGFTIGPEEFGEGSRPWLYHFNLSLHHDLSPRPLAVGSGFIVAPIPFDTSKESIQSSIFPHRSWEDAAGAFATQCAALDARQLHSFLSLPGIRAPEHDELPARIRPFLEEDVPPAPETCWRDPAAPQRRSVARLCARYDRARLALHATGSGFSSLPTGETSFEVTVVAGTRPLRIAIGRADGELRACVLQPAEPFPDDASRLERCESSIGRWHTAELTGTAATAVVDSEALGIHGSVTVQGVTAARATTGSTHATFCSAAVARKSTRAQNFCW